jgi:hypothetical protein
MRYESPHQLINLSTTYDHLPNYALNSSIKYVVYSFYIFWDLFIKRYVICTTMLICPVFFFLKKKIKNTEYINVVAQLLCKIVA